MLEYGNILITCEKGLFRRAFFRFTHRGRPLSKPQGGSRYPRHAGNDTNNKEVPLMRVKVTLRCNECKQRNYNTMKNKKNTPDKLELNKYCRFCKKHTLHSETK